MADAGRILIMPKGTYDASVSYEMLDLVLHNGASWLAKKTAVGIEPSDANSAYWARMTDDSTVRAEVEKIVNGTTTVGNADTVDGKHASDFTQFNPNRISGADALLSEFVNLPNLTTIVGNFTTVTISELGLSKSAGTYIMQKDNAPYGTLTIIANGVIATNYYNNGTWKGWTKEATTADLEKQGISPYFTSGETILSWANNPNGVYKKFVLGSAIPSDVPLQAEGFVELRIDEQGLRREVVFYQFGTAVTYEREIFNGAWRTDWYKAYATNADLGNYLPLSGGTIGKLTIQRFSDYGYDGGRLILEKSSASELSGNVAIDSFDSKVRIFEGGGNYRGVFLDLAKCTPDVQTELLHTGTMGKLREYLNVYADSSNAETYSSFIQNANGTHVRHVTDANNFDEFFIKQGNITYAKMVNGAWSETDVLHTGNKPTGSYTGNGSATSRTISTGGMGNVCMIWGTSPTIGNVTSILTWGGTISEQGGKVSGIASSEARFIDGGIVLCSTRPFLNESGATYNYQVL